MNKLKKQLQVIADTSDRDPEIAHSDADDILLEMINDEEVTEIFNNVKKWYA